MRSAVIGAALVILLVTPGCQEDGAQCVRDQDCTGGQVCADGVCSVVMGQDSAEHRTSYKLKKIA